MNLLSFLKRDANARKIFGKRELKIIEKQLLGINLTQSEKNRLSRDVRKKLQCIQQLARFQEEFSLKKGAATNKKIAEIKGLILGDPLQKKVQKIILFGSFVENTFTFRSDIDIAVLFDTITLKEATIFRKRILGSAPEQADVQVYNLLPKKIKKEIDQKGKVLYECKGTG